MYSKYCKAMNKVYKERGQTKVLGTSVEIHSPFSPWIQRPSIWRWWVCRRQRWQWWSSSPTIPTHLVGTIQSGLVLQSPGRKGDFHKTLFRVLIFAIGSFSMHVFELLTCGHPKFRSIASQSGKISRVSLTACNQTWIFADHYWHDVLFLQQL